MIEGTRKHTLLLAVAALLAFGLLCSAAAERQLVDGIAVVVGDQIILESEIDEEFYIYQMRMGSSRIPDSDVLSVRSEIVKEMVDELLLVAKAKRDTIELDPAAVDRELDRRVSDLKERQDSEEALAAALESQGLTLDRLKEIYRDDIERRLLAETVVRSEIHSKISVTWREVEDYYEEHGAEVSQVPATFTVAGILSVPKISEPVKLAAIERMTAIRDRLEAGESFEELARENSDDASAERGGDLGFIGRGTTVPEFEDALFALEVGEVSGIVPTRFGFHLIEVVEKEEARVRARHILARVVPGPEDDERAFARAESLRQMIVDGEDFAVVAEEYSDDPVSAERGGELGTFTREDLNPAFLTVVEDLDVGEVSDVTRGESGYYVLTLLAREDARVATLDEVRANLREYLFGLKAEEAYRELLDRLAEEIHVDIRTQMAPGS
jgi:peptidyl-prolyl cis-trans isomerase SurA